MFLQFQPVPRTEYTVMCYIYSTVASTSASTYQRTQPFVSLTTDVWCLSLP